MTVDPPAFRVGDRMPFCAGMTADRRFYALDAQAGRAAVLVLAPSCAPDQLQPLLQALAARRDAIAAQEADLVLLLGLAGGFRESRSNQAAALGFTAVTCPDDVFLHCGGLSPTAQIVVIDRATHIVGALEPSGQELDEAADHVLACLARLPREPARACHLPAPLLPVPHLLPPGLCQALIEGFESGHSFDSGVTGELSGADGMRLDPSRKRRRDWLLPAEALHETVRRLLLERCGRAIATAYQARVTHTDRILVACYDESGGYFRRHRDNTARAVAFRQFALSVNLNEAYEGGELLFPEYNDHAHRPQAGSGLIFSASLLHEATPVLRGQRYVLLTFLHDAAAEALRLAC